MLKSYDSNPANLPDNKVTQAEAAEQTNVSERAIRQAKKVQAEGTEELVAMVDGGELVVRRFAREENFLSGAVELVEEPVQLPRPSTEVAAIFLGVDQRWNRQR